MLNTDLILGSFDVHKRAWKAVEAFRYRDFVAMWEEVGNVATVFHDVTGDVTMTFEDLVKAETKRREIEKLTTGIQRFLDASTFAVRKDGAYENVAAECIEPMRQAGIEAVAARVVELLDECRSLGIDVTSARSALATVLNHGEEAHNVYDGVMPIDDQIKALLGPVKPEVEDEP